jgi:hypothetical protein
LADDIRAAAAKLKNSGESLKLLNGCLMSDEPDAK